MKKLSTKNRLKRLYRNQQIPDIATRLAKTKLPRILEITSNAPLHFIEGTIKTNILQKKEPDIQEIKKNLSMTISQYILIQKIGANNIRDLENPDPNDLKQLLEYKQIYGLKIDL